MQSQFQALLLESFRSNYVSVLSYVLYFHWEHNFTSLSDQLCVQGYQGRGFVKSPTGCATEPTQTYALSIVRIDIKDVGT